MNQKYHSHLFSVQKADGDAHFKTGMFERAVQSYTQALQQLSLLREDDTRMERATWLNNRAAASLQICDYDAVIRDCDQVLVLEGDNVKALVRRGLAYENTKKFEQAAAVRAHVCWVYVCVHGIYIYIYIYACI
jgi:tetratricopeptide (TPR) repeat protein